MSQPSQVRPSMSTEPYLDEDYASEEDSDFAPDAAPAGDEEADASDASADSGGEKSAPAPAKRKRNDDTTHGNGDDDDGGDGDFENSGDEAIISKGKRKQQKKKQKQKKKKGRQNDDDDDEEEDMEEDGGEGGMIKTRTMRAQEKAERKAAVAQGPVTVNVDDLWAQMTAGPVVPPKSTTAAMQETGPQEAGSLVRQDEQVSGEAAPSSPSQQQGSGVASADSGESSAMIKIKRTYNFAGKVHTEEKLVARDSAEAKVYLASLGDKAAAAAMASTGKDGDADADELARRRPRQAFRSQFEPRVEGLLAHRADLNLGVAARLQMREHTKAKKLNVVEKSRMDWAGFVDKEGIQDELELAGKSKQSFASRQDFLARVEAKRDEDARRARLAGRVL